MPETEPPSNPARSDAAGSRRAATPIPSRPPESGSSSAPGQDPPTVRSGGSSTSRQTPAPAGGPELPLPKPGERIDTYELEQGIGVGGMGAVFRALDSRLERQVALKILPPGQAHDPEVVQRFYQEGRAAARLDHENIARVYTIGHDGRYHYIVFEYIEGTTVRQRVDAHGPLPVAEAVNYTLQIADALVHASERGVVHRDIKPSNIVVTAHGRAKLVDMGLARRFERGGDDGLTQSGMTLGTFDYISPEQAHDPRDVDVRSDLYSLGCTLFHMLTGRPPFPGGTVLQKLIQHRDQAPPDVRSLNPAVPGDLVSVLQKLMAKDPDRRFQTPEQLVRDLLTVAGALGLRSVSPEGLVWLSGGGKPPAAWERHLVWGVPTIAFAAVVLALVWWSQDPGARRDLAPPIVDLSKPPLKVERAAETPANAIIPSAPPRAASVAVVPGPAPAESAAPRDIPVSSDDDLIAAIASAPPRSVVVLTDDGPYYLGETVATAHRLDQKDVTIKADDGVRPVLQLAPEGSTAGPPRSGLLHFRGGRVTLEGLEFVTEPDDRADRLAAVAIEDAELTARRCLFRHVGTADPKRLAALLVVDRPNGDVRAPAVLLDKCHIDGGQAGVVGEGPVDLQLRDCTVGAASPAFRIVAGSGGGPPEVRLRHVSVLAADGPVFQFEGVDPRVWIDDSVVAASGDVETTLLATDRPDSFLWRGRSNLYGRVGVYLLPTDNQLGREAILDPARWSESASEVRESGTRFVDTNVWATADPAKRLAQPSQDPTLAFRLRVDAGSGPLGVRAGPFVTMPPPDRLVVAFEPKPDRPASSQPATLKPRPDAPVTKPATSPPVEDVPVEPTPAPMPNLPKVGGMPEMPDMPVVDREKPADPVNNGNGNGNILGNVPEPAATVAVTPKPPAVSGTPKPPDARPAEPQTILRVEQFINALNDPSARGGVIRVAADADWDLPSVPLRVAGSWRVQAEAGTTRPRLRFLPAPPDPMAVATTTAMIDLRSGSLQLEGFDVILPKGNAPTKGRWAAFAVRAATDLSLTGCTVTVEGGQADSAVVSASAPAPGEREAARDEIGNGSPATVRVNDSVLRAGGDLIDVRGGQRLLVELNNTLVSTAGSLLRAHGLPRGQEPETIGLTLRQVTARTAGGLVRLESSADAPELPVADVNARDTVLVTSSDANGHSPLLRVDGQDAPSATRDRIRWEGHGVAYHQISTYRRDQSAQVGAAPAIFDRRDWSVAVGAKESTPVHGDVKFLRPWDADRPAWTLRPDDAQLAPDSPAPLAGPDIDRLPKPPAAD